MTTDAMIARLLLVATASAFLTFAVDVIVPLTRALMIVTPPIVANELFVATASALEIVSFVVMRPCTLELPMTETPAICAWELLVATARAFWTVASLVIVPLTTASPRDAALKLQIVSNATKKTPMRLFLLF